MFLTNSLPLAFTTLSRLTLPTTLPLTVTDARPLILALKSPSTTTIPSSLRRAIPLASSSLILGTSLTCLDNA